MNVNHTHPNSTNSFNSNLVWDQDVSDELKKLKDYFDEELSKLRKQVNEMSYDGVPDYDNAVVYSATKIGIVQLQNGYIPVPYDCFCQFHSYSDYYSFYLNVPNNAVNQFDIDKSANRLIYTTNELHKYLICEGHYGDGSPADTTVILRKGDRIIACNNNSNTLIGKNRRKLMGTTARPGWSESATFIKFIPFLKKS